MSVGSSRLWSRTARALCLALALGVCGAVRAAQPSEAVLERVRACLATSYEDDEAGLAEVFVGRTAEASVGWP